MAGPINKWKGHRTVLMEKLGPSDLAEFWYACRYWPPEHKLPWHRPCLTTPWSPWVGPKWHMVTYGPIRDTICHRVRFSCNQNQITPFSLPNKRSHGVHLIRTLETPPGCAQSRGQILQTKITLGIPGGVSKVRIRWTPWDLLLGRQIGVIWFWFQENWTRWHLCLLWAHLSPYVTSGPPRGVKEWSNKGGQGVVEQGRSKGVVEQGRCHGNLCSGGQDLHAYQNSAKSDGPNISIRTVRCPLQVKVKICPCVKHDN